MAKKKGKKKATPKPFLLANNPRNDNSCQCFMRKVPSVEWIVIARYATMTQCHKTVAQCSEFFMMMPLKKPHKKMGMGMA